MIFLEVDERFCGLMKRYAHGRLLVDCGAGEALFQSMMPPNSVLSLDLYPCDGDHAPVVQRDCTEFEFTDSMVPVFIRPCHSNFVHETITRNLGVVKSFLYVSMPDNVDVDLDTDGDQYQVERIFPEWEGNNGEHIHEVTQKGRVPKMETFVLVKRDMPACTWWYRKDGVKLVGTGGGYNFGYDDDVIIETVEAEDFESLDWSKSSLLQPDSDAGWLARDGKFYGCDSEDHDTLAYYLLKKNVEELEEALWVRVYGAPGHDPIAWTMGSSDWHARISAEQRNWLSLRGHKVTDDD